MFVRTQEKYRDVFKSIVGPTPDLRIFELTLFNILVGTYLEREMYIQFVDLEHSDQAIK